MLLVLLLAGAVWAGAATGSAPTSAGDSAAARPRVTLDLIRIGFEYRWEYRLSARVRARANGRPLSGLRVVARGLMDMPGHHMESGTSRLRDRGRGLYQAKVAFYMPGDWRISVAVSGARVASTTTSFDVTLK